MTPDEAIELTRAVLRRHNATLPDHVIQALVRELIERPPPATKRMWRNGTEIQPGWGR